LAGSSPARADNPGIRQKVRPIPNRT
jgi:hypothetical protein